MPPYTPAGPQIGLTVDKKVGTKNTNKKHHFLLGTSNNLDFRLSSRRTDVEHRRVERYMKDRRNLSNAEIGRKDDD